MPTNLALDDNLLNKALRLGGHRTKRETVNEALKEYIERRKREYVNLPPPPISVMSASFGPSNAVIGSFLARDVILYLARCPVPSELCVLTLDFETLEISRGGISI